MLSSQPPSAARDPVARDQIGRYQVLRKIATGGMAELFLAKQVGLDGFEKVVAIKRILAHLAHDHDFVQMFQDEARIVAQLHHPNIVQIYDLGKAEDTYFIAMEYIPGRNLSSIAKRSRAQGEMLPPTFIAHCISQACEGLYYAHTRHDDQGRPLHIVHRDVSPQNIIVSFSGSVKLVDFGIAKAATKIAHTRAGVLKGKYAYMSPEQIRGERTDARSDLFAVGIVLYELLCGRRPFEKDNSIQTLKAIVQEEATPSQMLNGAIPDPLAAIIQRCLRKSPDARFQTAQEVQLALEEFVSRAPQRVNNVAISQWVGRLFADELSAEQGATVNVPGLGEVVLPEPPAHPAPPRSVGAHQVPRPPLPEIALSRGRGGGSVSAGKSIAVDIDEHHRPDLIEEGVIERAPTNVGSEAAPQWDQAPTVHVGADDPVDSRADAQPERGREDSRVNTGVNKGVQKVRPNDVQTDDVRSNDAQTDDVRPNDAQTDDVRPNDVQTDDVRPNDVRADNDREETEFRAPDLSTLQTTPQQPVVKDKPDRSPARFEEASAPRTRGVPRREPTGPTESPLAWPQAPTSPSDMPGADRARGPRTRRVPPAVESSPAPDERWAASMTTDEVPENGHVAIDPWDESTVGLDPENDGSAEQPQVAVANADPSKGRARRMQASAVRRRSSVWAGAVTSEAATEDGMLSIESAADEVSDPSQEVVAAAEASGRLAADESEWAPFEDYEDSATLGFDDPWAEQTAADPGLFSDEGDGVDVHDFDAEDVSEAIDLGIEEGDARPDEDATVGQPSLRDDPTIDQSAMQQALDEATVDQSAILDPSIQIDEVVPTSDDEPEPPAFADDRTVSYDDEFTTHRPTEPAASVLDEASRGPEQEAPTAGLDEQPSIAASSELATVRSMDDEPELPTAYAIPERDDGRTVAGVASEIDVEADSAIDPRPVLPTPPPVLGLPRPSARRAAPIAAIELSRSAVAPVASEPATDLEGLSTDEVTVGHPNLVGFGPDSAEEVDDAAVEELFELEFAQPVHPSPLEAPPGEEDQISYQDEYSALVVAPQPLMEPPAAGPAAIGSTNVPPANLSLSQVLAHPAQAPRSRLTATPRIMGDRLEPGRAPVRPDNLRPASMRSASMVGRQIREVVRSGEQPTGARPPAEPPPRLDLKSALDVPGLDVSVHEIGSSPGRRWLGPVLATLSVFLLAVAVYLALPYVLGPPGPHLTIKTSPVGAQVLVDGTPQNGATPITISGLKPGVTYQIRLEREGYESVQREVQLPEEGPLIWQIPLRPTSVQK